MENYTYPPPPPPPSPSAVLHHRLITKYLLLLPGQQAISRDAALLAALAALHDLDEIVTRHVDARLDDWRNKHHDQTATISNLENALDDAVRRLETHRDSAELWRTQYDLSQTQLNAAEIECARLKTQTNESSQPTPASMASSAPAASNTSTPPAPTPPSPTASTTASADPAAPASSAPTSTPNRRRLAPKNPLPDPAPSGRLTLENEEAGQTTTPNPPPSPHLPGARILLANSVNLANEIKMLEQGKAQWRHYSRPLRLAILSHLWQPQWSKMSEFDRTRPPWIPTSGAISFLARNNSWRNIVLSITELKTPPSAIQT